MQQRRSKGTSGVTHSNGAAAECASKAAGCKSVGGDESAAATVSTVACILCTSRGGNGDSPSCWRRAL